MKTTTLVVRAIDLGCGNFRGEVWKGDREVYRTNRGGEGAEGRARDAAWHGYTSGKKASFARQDAPTLSLDVVR
jgi:hypothetical protein